MLKSSPSDLSFDPDTTMDPLALKLRHAAEEEIECWDDDGDLQGLDDLQLRSASTATSVTSSSALPAHHRDSISSRLSTRSDLDSNGGDHDWEVLIQDDNSTKDAIDSAKTAGIPIPDNVPKSALMGGTIKRLGGRKIKKAMGDDWSDDLELPGLEAGLKLKLNDEKDYPESLRQISAAFRKSPAKSRDFIGIAEAAASTKARITTPSLDKFRDDDDDDDDFFGDVPTIKVAKARSPQKPISFATPGRLPSSNKELESFEADLEFPADGNLKLSARKEIPRTPGSNQDDFDTEWAEGSLGTRFGGTKRDGRSNRSSSASAFSPSVSSMTAESEDEGLDGLILPDGPLKFDEALKRRQENQSPDPANYSGEHQAAKRAAAKEDFFSGLEIGDGDVFDSKKLTLNRNIKHKTARSTSPARRTQTTLTFTNKSSTTSTRIPRAPGHTHHHATLEPVSESGAPVPKFRRPESRLGGHSTQSSVSSIPTPTLPSAPSTPSTPSRRGLVNKPSREVLRNEPTTTNAQLLKAKRSMPAMRNLQSPARPPPYPRPPSRSEMSSRSAIPSRPKTPVDRSESSLSMARRPPVPFLPAGASQQQSHHISIKSSRPFRRHDSDGSNDSQTPLRPTSPLSNLRPETPGRSSRDLTTETLAAAAKRTMTKPTRRRNFGDGTELEIFDDLPTSATLENRFVKQPVGRGAPKSLRSKLGQSQFPPPSRTETPMPPSTPLSPTKPDYIPRFARDTAASRIAREQRVASTTINPRDREGGPLSQVSSNWKSHLGAARAIPSPAGSIKSKKGRVPGAVYGKPHLIKPLGNGVNEPKCKYEKNLSTRLY
jgi:hypothetical protein